MTDPTLPSEPTADVAALERRIAELEQSLRAAENERDVYKHIVSHAPAFISRLEPDGRLVWMNATCEEIFGRKSDDLAGQNILPLIYPGELMNGVHEYFRIAASGGDVRNYELTLRDNAGHHRTLSWNSLHRFGPDGSLVEVVSFGIDITTRKHTEAERQRLQDDVIAMQNATLAELSTPLIPISDDVVVMPLIGAIDEARARRIMETLLSGIVNTRARTAILDITGVALVDTHVADALLQSARAARLLGAQVILTGIRPEVAATLVRLGTELEGLITRSTLQSGIAFAMQHGSAARST